MDLSDALASKGLPTEVKSECDLDALSKAIKEAMTQAKLWQYYVIDVQGEVESAGAALRNGKVKAWSGEALDGKDVDELSAIAIATPGFIRDYRAFAAPFCTRVEPEAAAGFIQAAFPTEDATSQAKSWGKVLNIVNVNLYKEYDEDIKAAEDSIVGRIKYTRLDEHGPKLGKITKE